MGAVEIDLAFDVDPEMDPGAAGATAEPLIRGEGAEASWSACVRCWLEALAPNLSTSLRAGSYSLGLSLVDDATIASLNTTWRQKEGPTDVLAFAAQEGAPPLPPSAEGQTATDPLELGDIVISLETALRQALEADHSLEEELLFLASHGLLHLLGWDHPDERSLEAMLNLQNDLLSHTAHLFHRGPELSREKSSG